MYEQCSHEHLRDGNHLASEQICGPCADQVDREASITVS
jgi:hypothetical protein